MSLIKTLGLLLRRKKSNAKIKTVLPFAIQEGRKLKIVDLPVDIFMEILDYLQPHDGFIMSHTCSDLRKVTQRDWPTWFSRISYRRKVRFMTGLAYIKPNHWVCDICCRIHVADAPLMKGKHFCKRGPLHRGTGMSVINFEIQHPDIQILLKAARMGNTDIMRLISRPHRTRYTDSRTLYADFSAAPLVADGRFMVKIGWEFTNPTGDHRIDYVWNNTRAWRLNGHRIDSVRPDGLLMWRIICPHILFGPPSQGLLAWAWSYQPSQMEEGVYMVLSDIRMRAFQPGGHNPVRELRGSCSRCPTDFSVRVRPGKVTYQAWVGFGTYSSPTDLAWRVHVPDARLNNMDDGLTLHHEPGSVRELYESAEKGGE